MLGYKQTEESADEAEKEKGEVTVEVEKEKGETTDEVKAAGAIENDDEEPMAADEEKPLDTELESKEEPTIADELRRKRLIFDKTGTLTRNLMEFFKCSIGGETYGIGFSEIEMGLAKQNVADAEEVKEPSTAICDKGFNFDDARLMSGAWRYEINADMCKEFFRRLAICHTVPPEGEETPDKLRYQAVSPDEAALVTAAKNFGFFFL